MDKRADQSGTSLMPETLVDKKYETPKAVVKKTATAELARLVHEGGTPEEGGATPGKAPQSLPQARVMRPVVDVTGKEPPVPIHEKKASLFALGGRYPLDTYEQVKAASAYFDTYLRHFSPEDRHEYCTNMVKRADALGIDVSDSARAYGSSSYAPAKMLKVGTDCRKRVLSNEQHIEVLNKLAARCGTVPPDEYCSALAEFDKLAGLDAYYDRDVIDPYLSTFGVEKTASFSETIEGSTVITEADLKRLASPGHSPQLKKMFDDDFVKEFNKDPVGIFKSLPIDQKKLLGNMARDDHE